MMKRKKMKAVAKTNYRNFKQGVIYNYTITGIDEITMTYGPGQKDILNVNEFDKYFQKV
jgi:hypothetical protein